MALAVSIDGVFVDPEAARIPVLDRGFLYGDGAFEVLRTRGGRPVDLRAHLSRLQASLAWLGVASPAPRRTLVATLEEARRRTGSPDAYLRLQVTRGDGLGLSGTASKPRWVVVARPIDEVRPPPERYARGLRAVLASAAGIAPLAGHKTTSYLASIQALRLARAGGVDESIGVDAAGRLTEASAANVFVVLAGALFTPALSGAFLPGVTRARVLARARRAGLRALEVPLPSAWLAVADEVFLTSSIRGVIGVVEVDGLAIGDGRVGSVTRRFMDRDADLRTSAGARATAAS